MAGTDLAGGFCGCLWILQNDLHFYNDEECESLQYHNEQYDDEQYDDEQYDDDDDDEQYDNDCYNDHGVPRSTMYRPSKAARLV